MCSKRRTVENPTGIPWYRPVVEQWEVTGDTLCYSSDILSLENEAEFEVTNWHTRAHTLEEVADGLGFDYDDIFSGINWEICEGTVYRTDCGDILLLDEEATSPQRVAICDISLLAASCVSDRGGKAVESHTQHLVEECCYRCKHCPVDSELDCDDDDDWDY